MGDIKEKLSGVYAPMATPFRNDEIIFEGIIENVKKMNRSGLRGYFACGTNGEFQSLSVEERLKVMETVVKNASKDKVVMGGTAAESTKETIEITRQAAEIGVELVSLLMPHFFAKMMNDDALANYILDVAEASPVPVLLYNNPSVASGVTISPEVIKKVSVHPNVVGIKDSSKGNFKDYILTVAEEFYVLAGSANFFLDLLSAGGVGGVLSLANVFPDECVKLYRHFRNGRNEEAKTLNEHLVSLNKEVSGTYGVAGVKAAMDFAGFTGGEPRRPLKPLSESQKEDLGNKLMTSGFIK